MNKSNTKCRVCGKEYFCCSDNRKIGGWNSMACSPECFKEYMKRIEESRNPKPTLEQIDIPQKEKAINKRRKSVAIDEITDDED